MPNTTEKKDETEYLTGQLLVAMPQMEDQRFESKMQGTEDQRIFNKKESGTG